MFYISSCHAMYSVQCLFMFYILQGGVEAGGGVGLEGVMSWRGESGAVGVAGRSHVMPYTAYTFFMFYVMLGTMSLCIQCTMLFMFYVLSYSHYISCTEFFLCFMFYISSHVMPCTVYTRVGHKVINLANFYCHSKIIPSGVIENHLLKPKFN